VADSFHEDLRKLVAAEEGRDLRALLERVESGKCYEPGQGKELSERC
jgi:hypothetical protein